MFQVKSKKSAQNLEQFTCNLASYKFRRQTNRAHRPSLDELGFVESLAGVIFPLADVTDQRTNTIHYRAVAPAEMRDRWSALVKMRVVDEADQGIDPPMTNRT